MQNIYGSVGERLVRHIGQESADRLVLEEGEKDAARTANANLVDDAAIRATNGTPYR